MEVSRYGFVTRSSRLAISGRSTLQPITAVTNRVKGWVELGFTQDGRVSSRGVHGRIEFPVDSLVADNPLVELELRRRLDAKRYPIIWGEIVATARDDADLEVRGDVFFKGETEEVSGALHVERVDDTLLRITGKQRFDLEHWGFRPPRLGMFRVYSDIAVTIDVAAERR